MNATARHARRARPGRGRRDDGSVSTELVIVLPAVFLLTFLGVQAGMMYHARQVILAAANQGAIAAAGEYGTAADGHAAAAGFLGQTGDVALSSWSVAADRSAERVIVRVEAETYSVVPFWMPRVTAQASMPTERVVPAEATP